MRSASRADRSLRPGPFGGTLVRHGDPDGLRVAGDLDLDREQTAPAGRVRDGIGRQLGTSATGRSRTYRYYTCFSRARYGTHGCDAARLPADDTDAAVLGALADFYAQAPALITDAIARARARRQ